MKNNFLLIAVIAMTALAACNAQDTQQDTPLATFIKSKGDSLYKAGQLPGLFIGVIENGTTRYFNFGYADRSTKLPFDSATLFETGSITKTITAYIVEKVLAEKGITDTSSILPYLPDSVRTNKALGSISFLSLLNHTSGLPRLPDNMDLFSNAMAPYDHYDEAMLFTYLKNCTPQPNGKSSYSNLGAGLAGLLATRLTGESYYALADKYVFEPFKLGKAEKDPEQIKNKAQGYFESAPAVYWGMNVLGPAYIIKSTPAEMLGYLHHMAMPSAQRAAFIDSLLVRTVAISPAVNVCKAWHTVEEKGKPIIYWHNGGTYGFSTFAGFIKGKSKAVIVVTNQFNKNQFSDGLGIAIMKKLAAD